MAKNKKKRQTKGVVKIKLEISPELSEFLSRERVYRGMLTKLMWEYFKSNKLLDQDDRRCIRADSKLLALIGKPRFRVKDFMTLLHPHIVKGGTQLGVVNELVYGREVETDEEEEDVKGGVERGRRG